MCGIAGVAGRNEDAYAELTTERMTRTLAHRGPDDSGVWSEGGASLGSRRLAVLDPTLAGHQPMVSPDRRFVLVFNGEIYNYVELRRELGGEFHTRTDTEVLLRALTTWGEAALDRLNGMFALAFWDRRENSLLLARDRFGVKPLFYASSGDALFFASEVKALAAAGLDIESDLDTWREYLSTGRYDHSHATFFGGVHRLPPGHCLTWNDGRHSLRQWYDLGVAVETAGPYLASEEQAVEDLRGLLTDSVRIRFRADVPVGICLSGGLDSSLLVGVMEDAYEESSQIRAYHFCTGDEAFDETPWVRDLLAHRNVSLDITTLRPADVPRLVEEASFYQEEPFGGLPTLAMTKLFEQARNAGTIALMDGQGVDEQWGGYEYYLRPEFEGNDANASQPVQSATATLRPGCLSPSFVDRTSSRPWIAPSPFGDPVANLRYRDLVATKLPRTLRFSDHSSSQASCELREPFLDYRLVEFAFRQPRHHVISNGVSKYIPRLLAAELVGDRWAAAPKRPVQTPQREWLRGPLRGWAEEVLFGSAIRSTHWLSHGALETQWKSFLVGETDNAFFVWQWISIAFHQEVLRRFRDLTKG